MATPSTEELKRKIEQNRQLALKKRAEKLAEASKLKKGFNTGTSLTSSANEFYTPNTSKYTLNSKPNNSAGPYPQLSTNIQSNFSTSAGGISKTLEVQQKTWNVTTETITGTVSLISKDRFVLDIGFNPKLIDLCKTIPGRAYDVSRKAWTFPFKEYENFKKLTASLSPHIIIGSLPASILKAFSSTWDSGVDFRKIDISRIEPTILNTLYPFQKEGVQFGVSKSGRCMIADDMGLGKSIQALGIADYYRDDWPLLIVCPSSMRYQWQEEIKKNLPKIPSYSVFVLNNNRDTIERAKVVILSYDLMGTKKDFLKSYGFGVIILDECHSLKSIKTKRTKAGLDLVAKIRRVILLSGTPALSRPAELFTQIKAVNPGLFKDMVEFGIRYCEGKQDKFGWNFSGSSHLEELKVVLEEKIMIRRLKVDVLNQLPSKTRQVILIDSDMNNKTMAAFTKKLSNDNMRGSEKRSTLLAYFAETGQAKINAICKYVEQLLSEDKKFLVFAHHKNVMNAISETLEKNQTYYVRIDGTVNSEERKNVSDQFQEEADYKVAVLSLKAANTGITLTAARLVVFAELFWNPGELIQAEDRAHRIGQESNVLIQYLIAKGTADDYLWPLIQGKLNVLNQAGLTHSTSLDVSETKHQEKDNQSQITDFFSEIDNDVDDCDLSNLLDEIESVQAKKIKLS